MRPINNLLYGKRQCLFFLRQKNDVTIEYVGNAPFKIEGKTYLYGNVSDMKCGIDREPKNNVAELDYNTKNNILERVTYDSGKEQYYTIIDVISAGSEEFREHNTISGVYRLPVGENEKMLVESEIEEQEKEIGHYKIFFILYICKMSVTRSRTSNCGLPDK